VSPAHDTGTSAGDVPLEAHRRDFTDLTGFTADDPELIAAGMRQAVSAEHRRHKGAKTMRSAHSISTSAISTLAVGLSLTACSTSSYQNQASGLAGGLSSAKTAFVSQSEVERKSFIASQVRVGLRSGSSLIVPESCIEGACTPVISQGGIDHKIVYKPAAPEALELAGALDNYGKALLTLAQAKDIADLKDAAGKASSSASALASAFGGPAIGGVTGAGLGIINWFVGAYLDYRRFLDLRDIVNAADPSIEIAQDKLGATAKKLQLSVIAKRSEDLKWETTALAHLRQSGADRAKLQAAGERLVQEAIDLQAYAETNVQEPFVKMRKAHATLKNSLNHPSLDPGAAFAAISEFGKSIDAMNTAIAKLKTDK
jgi:hypothetical protein